MKKTRFNAAVSGLIEKTKASIRRKMIENSLNGSNLEAESKLMTIEEQMSKLVVELATGDSSNLKNNIQKLANLIQTKETLIKTKELSAKVTAYLDEEIDVEEKKEK